MSEPPLPALSWPDGLDEALFLSRYWQREPLLLRQALPGFESPLSPDELAGLALEPDTTPRLIRREAAERYTLEHGPFDEDVFGTLGPRDWSLLVTDVEKHLPELADWIAAFRLAPDWRFDDLMISYAPDGASVGAHVDEYDVFLLQASGTRRWSIARTANGGGAVRGSPGDSVDGQVGGAIGGSTSEQHFGAAVATFAPVPEHRTVAGGELALLAEFEPTDTWELVPGDVLYLPPGVPHHGVAVGDDCTTWSIGFRAPSAADAFRHLAELVAERLPHARLRDAGTGRGEPGRIEASAVSAVRALWERATRLDEAELIELTGRLLTRPDTDAPHEGDASGGKASGDGEDGGARSASPGGARDPRHDRSRYRPAPFARLAWSADGDGEARLFADGECLRCSPAFARRMCDPDGMPDDPSRGDGSDAADGIDAEAFATLVGRGLLILDGGSVER